MPTDVKDELAAFERELAHVIARFLRLYDRVEGQVRPTPASARRPAGPSGPQPPGYV